MEPGRAPASRLQGAVGHPGPQCQGSVLFPLHYLDHNALSLRGLEPSCFAAPDLPAPFMLSNFHGSAGLTQR